MRRTSRRRTSLKNTRRGRRTSKKSKPKSPGHSAGGFSARHGSLTGPGFSAKQHAGGGAFAGRIRVTRKGTGFVEFPNASQFPRIAREEGIPAHLVETAFGHLGAKGSKPRLKKNSGETPEYGSARRYKLGHVGADGAIHAGIAKGCLVLFDGKTKKVLWGVADNPIPNADKPLLNFLTTRPTSWDSAAKASTKIGVPPQAFFQAFSHHLSSERYRTLKAEIHRPR